MEEGGWDKRFNYFSPISPAREGEGALLTVELEAVALCHLRDPHVGRSVLTVFLE